MHEVGDNSLESAPQFVTFGEYSLVRRGNRLRTPTTLPRQSAFAALWSTSSGTGSTLILILLSHQCTQRECRKLECWLVSGPPERWHLTAILCLFSFPGGILDGPSLLVRGVEGKF